MGRIGLYVIIIKMFFPGYEISYDNNGRCVNEDAANIMTIIVGWTSPILI